MAQIGVVDLLNAMQASVQAIPAFAQKTVFAYNEEDFEDRIKGIKSYPGMAIVYEGMRSIPAISETGRSSAKIGMSAEAVISLILIEQGRAISSTDAKQVNAIQYLDVIRRSIMGTKSPTGHFWHFLVEAPAVLKSGIVYWAQRWSTPIQLPPGQPNPNG